MRRFRYRLERLLALRRHAERDWELRLARATALVIGTERQIAEARAGIAASYGAGAQGGTAIEADLLVSAEIYRRGLGSRIAALEADLERQRAALEEVRAGYLEASRRRKVLDKLKERQADAYRRHEGREAIAALNDVANARAARRAEAAAEPGIAEE